MRALETRALLVFLTLMSKLVDILGPSGQLANLIGRFTPRPGQQAMAEAIEEALVDQTDCVIEAATGTGKTLAYLLPVLMHTDKAIISTGTLNLQDQLFNRDLPLAMRALDTEKKVALLKGRANYLCLHRLAQYSEDESVKDGPWAEDFSAVSTWSRHTTTGDIAELESVSTDSGVWPWVTSTQDNCLGSDCPLFSQCHVVSARRQAQAADLVVVNHHLLFADLSLKQTGFGEVLPGADAIVIDEAHQIPETAMRFFSKSISAWQVRELVRDTLMAAGHTRGALSILQKPAQSARTAVDQAMTSFVDHPAKGEFIKIKSSISGLEHLLRQLRALQQALLPLSDQSRDLAQCSERATALERNLNEFLAGDHEHIRWFAHRQGRFSLHLTPLDIASPLQAIRAQIPATWIMTSATLSVAGHFDHFTQRLGLERCRELTVPTPFDYVNKTRLYIPTHLPDPSSSEHTEALLQEVVPLLKVSQGRAFLLFTSHRALRCAATWLRANTDFNLQVQEEATRRVLLDRFLNQPNSLLLGAQSFWEGVDVPGISLSVVVIDKLPFAPPDDPILEATVKAAEARGERAFATVQIPNAVLSLKQGAGRLIRQAEDFGVLVIGDPRLKTRPYGRIFMKSLPPMKEVQSVQETIDFMYEQLDQYSE